MAWLERIFVVVFAGLAGGPGTATWAADGHSNARPDPDPSRQLAQAVDPDLPPRFNHRFRGEGLPEFGGGRRLPDNYGTVIGPGGVVKPMPPTPNRQAQAPKKRVPTPAEKAEAIRKALAPKPALAVARRHTLDELYAKLAKSGDEDEAKGLAGLIGNIWMRSGSDTANLLMQRAIESFNKKNLPVAHTLLDKLVGLQPQWAEAWNKRASVKYLEGDLDGSMADVEHVLKLEPNHFGALEGMATILRRNGLNKRALQIYRRVLAVYPHQPEIQKAVDKLTLDVEGQGI